MHNAGRWALVGALVLLSVVLFVPASQWDHLRHYAAFTFNADAVAPNIGAWVYCGILAAALSYVVWPRVRASANAWVKGHLAAHFEEHIKPLHDKIDALK